MLLVVSLLVLAVVDAGVIAVVCVELPLAFVCTGRSLTRIDGCCCVSASLAEFSLFG